MHIDFDRGRRLGKPSDELFDFARGFARVDPSRALLNMLGMRNYLGKVEVSSEIKGLIPKIDRQGFVENEVFEELRKFARLVVDWANIQREQYIHTRQHLDAQKLRQAIEPVLDLDVPEEQVIPKAANFLRREIERIVEFLPSESQPQETQRTLDRTIKAIEATHIKSYQQLRHLRLVASASTLTLLFAHEVRSAISSLGAEGKLLRQLAQRHPDVREQLIASADALNLAKDRLDHLVKMTGIVGTPQEGEEIQNINVRSAARHVLDCFRLLVEDYDIEIGFDQIPAHISVGPMHEGELFSILINLVSNAAKAVIAESKPKRIVRLETVEKGSQITIRVLDNGIGLPEVFFSDVFVPFLADPTGKLYDQLEQTVDPEDSLILGTGSGLGLPIARDIARSRKGDIKFVIPPENWATCVEVYLP